MVDSNLLLLLSLLLLFLRLLFSIDPISKRKVMIKLGIAGIRTYDRPHPRSKFDDLDRSTTVGHHELGTFALVKVASMQWGTLVKT